MRFEVDTGRLSGTTNSMKDYLTEIANQQKKMDTAMEQLNGLWHGPSHDLFISEYAKDAQKMNELISALSKVINHFSTANNNYNLCEDKAVNIAKQIRI